MQRKKSEWQGVAYYFNEDDGGIFTVTSDEAPLWTDLPDRGFQIIIYYDRDDGWTMRHGCNVRHGDFFRLDEDGCVVGMDLTGLIDYTVHVLHVAKEGQMLSQKKWAAVLRAATLKLQELQRQDGSTINRSN